MDINKNSYEADTCYNKNYDSFLEGINNQMKYTYFSSSFIQFLLIFFIHCHLGKGKYWNIILWASASGFIGSCIEGFTLAYICRTSQIDNNGIVVPFLIEEIFRIMCEYSIPLLNLIRMGTVAKNKKSINIKYIIIFLFIPFSVARLLEGYDRMMKGYLATKKSNTYNAIAFGIMAISDVICTCNILYLLKFSSISDSISNTNLFNYIKTSSYTILICIDIVNFIISILYIISNIIPYNIVLEGSINLFYWIKSIFLLILGIDSIIFKYHINTGTSVFTSNNTDSFGSDLDPKQRKNSLPNGYVVEVISTNIDNDKFYNSVNYHVPNYGRRFSSASTHRNEITDNGNILKTKPEENSNNSDSSSNKEK